MHADTDSTRTAHAAKVVGASERILWPPAFPGRTSSGTSSTRATSSAVRKASSRVSHLPPRCAAAKASANLR